MAFVRMGGQVIAFSRISVYIGGKGKVPRVRLCNEEGPIADEKPCDFADMVQDGTIKRLDLPRSLRAFAERLSKRIGDTYTPQEALRIFQQRLQDHATTLETDIATSPAPVGEAVTHG
jgi:hypothetical protein